MQKLLEWIKKRDKSTKTKKKKTTRQLYVV